VINGDELNIVHKNISNTLKLKEKIKIIKGNKHNQGKKSNKTICR
jgi:hypothetical protein